jgi:hypothetical protein
VRTALPGKAKSNSSADLDAPLTKYEPVIRWWIGPDLPQKVAGGEVDVGLLLLPARNRPSRSRGPGTLRVQLVWRENSALSRVGLDFLETRLQALNEQYFLEQLAALRVPARVPVMAERRAVRDTRPALSLTTLIPLILILMTITGAV